MVGGLADTLMQVKREDKKYQIKKDLIHKINKSKSAAPE
ncbi:MAG: hypothetical protein IFNCLDLE_01664 [Ignavibacteriaceae bacterium]|nr:hypothetical protein [Ignavibacteriaceae bacterium]